MNAVIRIEVPYDDPMYLEKIRKLYEEKMKKKSEEREKKLLLEAKAKAPEKAPAVAASRDEWKKSVKTILSSEPSPELYKLVKKEKEQPAKKVEDKKVEEKSSEKVVVLTQDEFFALSPKEMYQHYVQARKLASCSANLLGKVKDLVKNC